MGMGRRQREPMGMGGEELMAGLGLIGVVAGLGQARRHWHWARHVGPRLGSAHWGRRGCVCMCVCVCVCVCVNVRGRVRDREKMREFCGVGNEICVVGNENF